MGHQKHHSLDYYQPRWLRTQHSLNLALASRDHLVHDLHVDSFLAPRKTTRFPMAWLTRFFLVFGVLQHRFLGVDPVEQL